MHQIRLGHPWKVHASTAPHGQRLIVYARRFNRPTNLSSSEQVHLWLLVVAPMALETIRVTLNDQELSMEQQASLPRSSRQQAAYRVDPGSDGDRQPSRPQTTHWPWLADGDERRSADDIGWALQAAITDLLQPFNELRLQLPWPLSGPASEKPLVPGRSDEDLPAFEELFRARLIIVNAA